MDFLFGPSPTQRKIDQATSDLLMSTDWAANLDIIDIAQHSEDGGREIVKAIQKRMGNKNPKVAKLTLDLLEACVKNCGPRFHVHVHDKAFLDDLVKVGLKKGQHEEVRAKVLTLIIDWAEAFGKDEKRRFPNFEALYQSLRQEGVEFPARDLNALSPVFTPPAHPKAPAPPTPERQGSGSAPVPEVKEDDNPLASCTPQYVLKTKQDLAEVMNFVLLLREILEAQPDTAQIKKDDTARELLRTLHAMQGRITRLLVELLHEELMELCITVNDNIREAVNWYKAVVGGQADFKPAAVVMPDNLKNLPDVPEMKMSELNLLGKELADGESKGEEHEPEHEDDDEHKGGKEKDILNLSDIPAMTTSASEEDEFDKLAKRDEAPAVSPDQINVNAAGEGETDKVSNAELSDLLSLTDKPPAS